MQPSELQLEQIAVEASRLYERDYPLFKYAVDAGRVEYTIKAMESLGYKVVKET